RRARGDGVFPLWLRAALRAVGWRRGRERLQRAWPSLCEPAARGLRLPPTGRARIGCGSRGDGGRDRRAGGGGAGMSLEPDSVRRVYEGSVLGLTVERWGEHEREIVEHPGGRGDRRRRRRGIRDARP